MPPMLIIKFGPLGTDLDRMTLKLYPRKPVITKSKLPTFSNMVIFKIVHIFHVTYDIDLKFGMGDVRVCTNLQEPQQCNIFIYHIMVTDIAH